MKPEEQQKEILSRRPAVFAILANSFSKGHFLADQGKNIFTI
jgi:hypothetical protein